MSLRRNVFANYFGQGWTALMGLAFVPFYIKYLGIEAYGLIGIFALLQGWLGLLDMGMKPALGREMARFTAGAHTPQSIRDLLRSVELIGIILALAISIGIWAASEWLAFRWVIVKALPTEEVARAFVIMGIVTALRFVENIYSSSIVGLQRQVLQNLVTSLSVTVRGLGAVCVLAWISPTLEAFFLWQGFMSLVNVALLASLVYSALPRASQPVRFSAMAIRSIWRFSAGMMVITFLALLLTQIDKILLSRILTLDSFAYYALAGVVANGLYTLVGPISTALAPRFTELAEGGDVIALSALYHQGAQLVTVLMGSAAIVLMVFGDRVLRLWAGNMDLIHHSAPLLTILSLGTMLHGLMWVPYQMQLAHGWTALAIKVNLVAVSVLVPSILLVVPVHGAKGGAWVWVTLNAGYVVVGIPLMHCAILPNEKWRWYIEDVAIPLISACSAAFFFRLIIPGGEGRLLELGSLFTISVGVLLAAALFAPAVRIPVVRYARERVSWCAMNTRT